MMSVGQWALFAYPVMGGDSLLPQEILQLGCDVTTKVLAVGMGERSTFGFATIHDLGPREPQLLRELLRRYPRFMGPVWRGQISDPLSRSPNRASPQNRTTLDAFTLTTDAAFEAWTAGRKKGPFPDDDFLASDDESLMKRLVLFTKAIPWPVEAR